jgi:hypothetical protein
VFVLFYKKTISNLKIIDYFLGSGKKNTASGMEAVWKSHGITN